MSLKDVKIPNDVNYIKLRDFPDGERIAVCGCGVNMDAKFGPMAFFITPEKDYISLPARYTDYIIDVMAEESYMNELKNGIVIVKNSRETKNGGTTPIFDYL